MNYQWITSEDQVQKDQKWFPDLSPLFLEHMDVASTLAFSVNGVQYGLVQGYKNPDVPGTWLVQRAYFANATPKSKRLWVRSGAYHQAWVKACQEALFSVCVIKFAKGSSIEKAYGQNIVAKYGKFYKDAAWWEDENGLSYLRVGIPQ
jgi:hypothetical protein